MARATHRLTGVDVRYISLAGRPKNGRAMILKGDLAESETVIERETRIVKADPVRRMAYGVVYAPDDVDADGHTMSAAEIERAMLGFMAKGRVGAVDTDHDEATGGAYVAESWLVKAGDDGATLDATFPGEAAGTWAVGIKVDDAATWDRIEKGEITGLSFAGVAAVEAIPADETPAVAKGNAVDATGEHAAETLLALLVRKARETLGTAEPAASDAETPAEPAAETPAEPVTETVDAVEAVADLQKAAAAGGGIATLFLRSRLWETTSALGEALRVAMDQTDVPVRAAVQTVLDEYAAWLLSQMSEAASAPGADAPGADAPGGDSADGGDDVTKATGGGRGHHAGIPIKRRSLEEPLRSGGTATDGGLTLERIRDVVSAAVAPIEARLEAIETQTPGRQSAVGDDVAKAARPKGLRIL